MNFDLLSLLLLLLFHGALDYLDIVRIQAYAIKCVKRANVWFTRRTKNVLSTFDYCLVTLIN